MGDGSGLILPSAERVAARAAILATVTCRGSIDADGPAAGDLWNRAQQWLGVLGIEAELEDGEKAVLAKPLGALAPQEQIDACWLCEGMVVLAWALGRYEMPAYDRQIVAADVAEALGFLKPQAETALAKPVLRP